jgi:trigger factor
MQVTETNSDGLKREFKIVVPASQFQARMEGKLVEIARTIRMPGFRPGKVPMPMVRKKYAGSVMGEVLEAVVNDGVHAAISERSLRPAAQPKVEFGEYAEGKDIEFTVQVEVMPEIKAMDFATVSLEREKADVPEAEIDEALKRIAERSEQSEPVERAAQAGDVVVIDFVGRQDGIEFPGGSAEGYSLKLGSGTFIPGFEEQLTGKAAGDKALVQVTFPDAYGNEALAGKGAEFDVTVKEVRQTKAAALDDELAKSVGMETIDALKQAVKDELGRELDAISRQKLKRKLLDVLAESHDFPVPASLADQEFDAVWKQVDEERQAGRLDAEDAAKSEDDLKADYRKLSERRVRLGLLLADVGRSNNVTVTQEDMNRGLLNEARKFPGQEHLVFQYYKNNPEALESLKAPLFEDKVVDFILELATVADKAVSAEELRKEPDAVAAPAEEAKPKKKAAAKKKSAE